MTPGPLLRRFAPYGLVLALALTAWLAGTRVPYRVDTDTGFQLGPVLQWVRGDSPAPVVHRLPDPRDLSRDTLVWSNWWPPGFPVLYAPLARVFRFADALRVTSLLLFLAGSLGWLRLADGLGLPLAVRLLYAASLVAYALTLGGPASLRWQDLLAYAVAPWLALLVLRRGNAESGIVALLLCGFALGATYWLRYALFLVAVPLLAWIAFQVGFDRRSPGRRRLVRLAALGLGFALPVLALFVLNLRLSDNLTESVTGTRSAIVVNEPWLARPAVLALSLVGAPGLGLFQNELWITHLLYFSDARLPFLAGLDSLDRILLKSLLGAAVTAALAWGLVRGWRRHPGPYGSLAATALVGFYLGLAAVSLGVGYNYLAQEPRFAAGVLPLLQPLVLAGWLARDAPRRHRVLGSRILGRLLLATVFALPLAFAAANFVRNEIGDRWALGYQTPATGLYQPEVSSHSVPAVRGAMASALRSPRDLVVLAGPSGWGSSFVMWLEIPWRTLPVGTFPTPLGARYLDAADIRGTGSLRSSQPLRVVLVAARTLAADGSLARLRARFPQARAWHAVPVPPHSNVLISYSDLEVP